MISIRGSLLMFPCSQHLCVTPRAANFRSSSLRKQILDIPTTLRNTTPTTYHERRQHVLPLRLLGTPHSIMPAPMRTLTVSSAGRLPDPPPAPQSSPLASLRRSAEVLPLHRSPLSNRQGRCFCACGAVHEGHPRDSSVRLLARCDPDPWPPGRQPAKVHCVQRA